MSGQRYSASQGGHLIGKIIACNRVNPVSGCSHVVRGETEEELLRNAEEHAKERGIVQVSPELLDEIKTHVQDD